MADAYPPPRSVEQQGYIAEIQRRQRMAGQQRAAEDWNREHPGESATPPGGAYGRSVGWLSSHIPDSARHVSVPSQLPRFLGNRQIVFGAWIIAMLLVGADEWRTHHWFPRPARLWWATSVYAILMAVSQIDALVPICNALAIGYDVTLAYEYYSGGNISAKGWQFPGASTGSHASEPGSAGNTQESSTSKAG